MNKAEIEVLRRLVDMCKVHGDFRNGVTDSTGSIDEGDVLAGRIIDDADKSLRLLAAPPPPEVKNMPAYDDFMRVAWAAKEFIDDWKKGDFSLSTLAALDAQSLDEALTKLSETLNQSSPPVSSQES